MQVKKKMTSKKKKNSVKCNNIKECYISLKTRAPLYKTINATSEMWQKIDRRAIFALKENYINCCVIINVISQIILSERQMK